MKLYEYGIWTSVEFSHNADKIHVDRLPGHIKTEELHLLYKDSLYGIRYTQNGEAVPRDSIYVYFRPFNKKPDIYYADN